MLQPEILDYGKIPLLFVWNAFLGRRNFGFACFSLFLLGCVGFVLILVSWRVGGQLPWRELWDSPALPAMPACTQSWIGKELPSDRIPSCCCAIVVVNFMDPIFDRILSFCIVILLFVKCVGLFHSFFLSSFQQMENITLFNLFFYNVKWISSINTLICFLINSLRFSSLFAGTLNPECSSVNSVIWLFKGEAMNFMIEAQC